MKTWVKTMVGGAALVLLMGIPAGFMQVSGTPVTGGLSDTSDYHAPKTIASEELIRFSLTRGNLERYKHTLLAEKTEAGTHLVFDCVRGDGQMPLHFENDFSDEVIRELADLIRQTNLAAVNGQSKRNSALGTYISLHVDYASGEKITAYAEGGASTIPDGWPGDDAFVNFFLEKFDETYALSPALDSMYYRILPMGDAPSVHWSIDRGGRDGKPVIRLEVRGEDPDSERTRMAEIPEEKIEELKKLVMSHGMKDWIDISEGLSAQHDEITVIGLFFRDKQGEVTSEQNLPFGAQEAFRAVREFLENTLEEYERA